MSFEKNSDPNYFIDHQLVTNCGSLALNIKEWYCPDEVFDTPDEDYAYYLIEKNKCTLEAAIKLMLARNVEQILKDFDFLELCSGDRELARGEELIAFRMCLSYPIFGELDTDYHFRVKRNNRWLEKPGCGPVREVDFTEEPWVVSESLVYWGPIAYFLRKAS